MKQAIATLLRHRSAWQLVTIAAVGVSVALLIAYGAKPSTRTMLKPLSIGLFGTAGAALILAVVRRGEEIAARGDALRGWSTLLAGVLGLSGLIAYVTYGFGHFNTRMRGSCNGSLLADTAAEREADLVAAEAQINSPFGWLPRLVDDKAGRECARSREDFSRSSQGLCTRFPLVDRPCACGEESYPYARCKEPTCMTAPGLPDKFDCPGDPVIPEYWAIEQ